ncbi:MAG: helix-hairpin-helix domain-containing protein [Ignavibacteriales bacterium]|nr:helix-hairpin-helix domain-containing protein [Ignavibacteriales bacterium]
MRKKLLLLVLTVTQASAQDQIRPDSLVLLSPEIEVLLEDETAESEESFLYGTIADLAEQPIDLNTASFEELQQIPGMTSVLAYRIVSRRERNKFSSLRELRKIDGMTGDVFESVRPFLVVGRNTDPGREMKVRLRFRTQSDLQPKRGLSEKLYRGSREKLYHRMSFVSESRSAECTLLIGTVKGGVVLEKDAGERFQSGHAAGFLQADVPAASGRLILGDFSLFSGVGLILGPPGPGSLNAFPRISGSGPGFHGYASTAEDLFFRGLAFAVSLPGLHGSGFYSNRGVHASVSDEGAITRFDGTGLFRTSQEEQTRFATRERVVGGMIGASPLDGMRITLKGYAIRFAHPLDLSQYHDFHGQDASLTALDFSYTQDRQTLFWEAARDHKGSVAVVTGGQEQIASTILVGFIGRWFPRSFNSRYGRSLTRNTVPENEQGLSLFLKFPLMTRLRLSVFYDFYRLPLGSRSIPFPASGNEALILADVSLGMGMKIHVLYRQKSKGIKSTEFDELNRLRSLVGERTQKTIRINLHYGGQNRLEWQSRVETTMVESESKSRETGFLISQNFRWTPVEGIRIHTRLGVYETDSYDSRLYEFEHDVPGAFSNPPLFGKGTRSYVLVSASLIDGVDVSFKYAATRKEGVKSLGSGLDEVSGDLQNRISLQTDVRF